MGANLRSWKGVMPVLGERVYVDPAAVVVGQVSIGDDSSVWPTAVIRGDVNVIAIGARTSVQDGCVLHVTHDGPYNPGGYALSIGDDVTIGHRAILHGCTIGDNTLVGMGAIVMNGSTVGSNCVIGAGALIGEGKTIPDNSLVVGMPGKVIRTLDAASAGQVAEAADIYVRKWKRYVSDFD